MNKVKVYRNGSLVTSTYTGEILDYAAAADKKRIDSTRPGRCGSLYASPSITGVLRWVHAHLDDWGRRDDVETYELTVDGDTTYVYDIHAWENHSWHNAPAVEYWETGITLTEYLRREEDRDDQDWEVLIAPEDVLASRRVSAKRLVANSQDPAELKDILRRNRVR